MGNNKGKDVDKARYEAINAAKSLRYGKETIEKLREAKTHGEIERIMIGARHECFKD